MQWITRICIRWNHMMHADRSLAKWSALYPRVKFIVHELSPRAIIWVSRRRDFYHEKHCCTFLYFAFSHFMNEDTYQQRQKRHCRSEEHTYYHSGKCSISWSHQLESCNEIDHEEGSLCRSFIYNKKDVAIFLILSPSFVLSSLLNNL